METRKKLQRFLSIFLACIMIMNVPMSAMAFDDVMLLDVVEDMEPIAVEEELDSSEEAVLIDEVIVAEEILAEEGNLDDSLVASDSAEAETAESETEITLADDESLELTDDFEIYSIEEVTLDTMELASLEEDTVTAEVSFLAQADGEFLLPPQLNFQVASDTAENYGYTDQTNKATEVSTIDVLVAAHAAFYGDDFTEETSKDYLVVDGNFVTSIFQVNFKGNFCILVNNYQPGNNGVEQAVVTNGDLIEFFVYQDKQNYQDRYVWLELPDGTKLDGAAVYAGKNTEIVAKGYIPFSYSFDENAGVRPISGASLCLVDVATGAVTDLGITTGEDGTAKVAVPEAYVGKDVYLTAKGSKMAMTLAKVKVEEAPISVACDLLSLEVAVGGNTIDTAALQTLNPVFSGTTVEYITPVLDYVGDKNSRFVLVKVNAPEGTNVTAKCGSSDVATLVSNEWGVLQVQGGYFWSPTYSGPLNPGTYNQVIITVSKEGETDKTYTVTIPMQPDISNRSLVWKTDLVDVMYFEKDAENAALTVEAQYKNRPLENEDVITYQWYSNTAASTEGGTAIEGATAASYNPAVTETGTSYYYVVASCNGLENITSKVIAVTVAEEKAPKSVRIVCDHPYTIPDTWASALGGVKYVAKVGDTLQLKAVGENGEETPVNWLNTELYGGTLDRETGIYTITSTSYSYVQVASLYDSSIKSEEKAIQVVDYSITQQQKTPSVTLSEDGQSFQKISTMGGIDTYTLWNYIPSAENIAELTSDLNKKPNYLVFTAMRPGTIEASFDLDLNGDSKADGNGHTDSAVLSINGIAVEDADGKLTKTYLDMNSETPAPTVQLKALSSTENAAFTWSSADEKIATVDENGLVTAKGVGSVIISANDGTYTGGIKVVVTSSDTPYFEQIDFTTTTAWSTGLSNATWKTANFKPTVLNYTGLSMTKAAAGTLTMSASTLYDTEKYIAEAVYTDANGEQQNIAVNSASVTELKNLPFETSKITINLTDKTDETKKTVYTFEVTRPRDTTKTIASSGIVFAPVDREIWKDKYDNKTEGIMYVANEDGSFAQYQGVSSSRYYYRTYAMNALEAFQLSLKGASAYAHIRFSVDDGITWTDLGMTGTAGVSTGSITFPEKTEEGNPVAKVMIQILDDLTYAANVAAEKDGFADSTPNTYTVWVEQIPVLSAECDILTAVTDTGDWYPTFDSNRTSYRIVVAPSAEAPVLTFTVSEDAKVTIGDSEQIANEDGEYTLTLTNTAQDIVVTASDGMTSKTYFFGYSEKESIYVPDKVVDFLSVNSQYINGNGGGYGVGPQQTLTGGLLSLGNFGGYVTFYLENGLTDNPNNAYGVDFYVNGNAFKDTSTGTGLGSMEPGQVWVSQDGSTWYALAGSEHYEPSTLWNYSVTYKKTETGGTSWSDNYGNTDANSHGRSFAWPDPGIYTMNNLAKQDSFTLTGILLPCVNGTITGTDNFNSFSKGGRFGYVDMLPNGTANPYLDNSNYGNESSGFDLAWAVDASGNPVDVSGMSFHYVKVVTASNIIAGSANEKSTEVANLVVAAGQDNAVGETAEPTSITFISGENSYTLPLEEDKQIYEVEVPKGMSNVSLKVDGTAEDDNIYINNQRVKSGNESNVFGLSTEARKLIRVIVQNGEKEPVIYLLKVKESTQEKDILPRLSNMVFRNGTGASSAEFELSPAFDPKVREYTIAIPDSIKSTTIGMWAVLDTESVSDTKIKITANYTALNNNTAKSVSITSGKSTGASLPNLFRKNLTGNTLTVKIGDDEAYKIQIVKEPTLSALNFTADGKTYELNESLDAAVREYSALTAPNTEITVNAATYSEGVKVLINGSEEKTIQPEWKERTCDLNIVLSADGAQDTSYKVKLNQVPVKLEISQQPEKTEYKPGDIFDLTGMQVNAVYADGGIEAVPVEEITVEPAGVLTQNTSNVTLSYHTISVAQPITVTGGFKGTGTASDPFLIETVEDYQKLNDMVSAGLSFAGQYFRQQADITLPADWDPIGTLINPSLGHINAGKNVHAFSGTINGNGYTITIPEGGLPLLDYVIGATVKNLNIYGKKIAGYGLVNHFEGVDLHGTAINIDHVTLKAGSSTLKSGFIGTYITSNPYAGCTLDFVATITNCTIEKNVVIGYNKDQSNIGSFAGRFNGSIENCVSYATVYGVDYVGGILGARDNSMGTVKSNNCEFYGTVLASGNHVGGILGGGHQDTTAPNALRATINNCYVNGTVTGADKVGGILGGDTYVAQVWNPYTFKNNIFTGKVQVTEGNSVGGIIGFYDSLNKFDDISGNYYVSDCGADKGIGTVVYVDTSCIEHETESDAIYLNTAESVSECPTIKGCAWKKQHNRTDDPLGADAAKLCYSDATTESVATELILSGEYSTDVTIGEQPDFAGMVLTVKYSDGTTQAITMDDVRVKGFDAYKLGEQTITLAYGKLSANVTVKVMNAEDEVVKVTFTLLGDKLHNTEEDGEYHTWAAGNLETWIAKTEYEFTGNATVLDILEQALEENGMSCRNESGSYIQGITRDGVELAEFDNGAYTGWMYKLNGKDSSLSVIQQYLKAGDDIVFHYTDYYPEDDGYADETGSFKAESAIIKLPSVTHLTLENKNAVEAARAAYDALSDEEKAQVSQATLNKLLEAEAKIAELKKAEEEPETEPHVHSWGTGTITKAATCKETGVKTYKCSCGQTKTETIAKSTVHKYGSWATVSEATVKAAEVQKHICSVCSKQETRNYGSKLAPVLEVPGKLSSISIKKGKTAKFDVTMAKGDSVSSVASSKTKYLKATLDKTTGKITLKGLKKGSSSLTITLASGKTRTYTVKVTTGTVKTSSLSVTNVTNKNLILKAKESYSLKNELKPFTTTQKVTYKSSNKKIAKVTSGGKITAVAPGKTTITVASGSKKVKITVNVAGITGLKSSVSVKKNKTLTLKPKLYGISGTITYTSSDPDVAAVASNGKIKGIKKGSAKITVKAGTYSKTVTVKVK